MTAQVIESQVKKSGVEYVDSDGCTYIDLYVASACTANTPYAFYTYDSSNRALQSAMAASGQICKVVVATETLTAAGYSKFKFKGVHEDLITPSITGVTGQTLKIASAAVAAGGAATITADDFAVVNAGATATSFDVVLLGREITPS
jgi:hypothetical protein